MVAITEKEFQQLSNYIKGNYGINLKEEKKILIMGRLYSVLEQKHMKNFSEYFNYILSDKTGDAAITLINKITTNHTFFMREEAHFDYFKSKVLPYFSHKIKDRDFRTWSAGCSSGEEAYTLAMILDEFVNMEKSFWDTKILATDISSKVLDIAKRGIYSNEQLKVLPSRWRLNYLKKYDDDNYIITDKIKKEVIFRKFNLMEEIFPFKKKFHVIFCRNVMIYFDNATKNRLINKFYEMTEYGGYLFIGHSESVNKSETKYKYIMPAVYRKE